jgi:CP family cyanate transporter-like MFS transporter
MPGRHPDWTSSEGFADIETPGFSPSSHPYRWVMLAGAWLIYFCFGLTFTALAPLVRPISQELGLSHSEMGLVLGSWSLVYIASAVPCGALLDRFGPRRALFAAAMIMGLSGCLRGFATGHLSLFLAVAAFGLGGPFISIGGPKLVSLWFEGKERGLAMGIFSTSPPLGGVGALVLTNSLFMPIAGGNWRAVLVFYAGLVLMAGIVWLAISGHRASRAVERQIAAEPKRSQLAVFAGLLRLKVVRVVLLMSVGIFLFNQGLVNWLPEILRRGGMDAATAGYWASVPIAISIFSAMVIPHLAIPSRRLFILLCLFICAGGATFLVEEPAGAWFVAGLFLQGTARGAMRTVALLVLMDNRDVETRDIGSVGGLFFSAAEIGGVLGPLAMGYLFDATGGFSAALYMLSGVCAALMLLVARLRRLDG